MDASFPIISSNIRFDNPADGENDWSHRREILADILKSHHPLIVATQEGRKPQLKDLEELLSPLTLVESHRDWIDERMYPCLYINFKHFELVRSGDIWLSETPTVAGSHSFGSAFPRLLTWARVKGFGKQWLFASTHFDHVESSTRIRQAEVLCREISAIRNPEDHFLLLGDFNDHPLSDVHRYITRHLELNDHWRHVEESSHHPFSGEHDAGARIDWILSGSEVKINSIEFDKSQRNGKWPSDHFPVVCKIKL